jgi:hypothetical protein
MNGVSVSFVIAAFLITASASFRCSSDYIIPFGQGALGGITAV